jgi:hypothetical protein
MTIITIKLTIVTGIATLNKYFQAGMLMSLIHILTKINLYLIFQLTLLFSTELKTK